VVRGKPGLSKTVLLDYLAGAGLEVPVARGRLGLSGAIPLAGRIEDAFRFSGLPADGGCAA